MQLPSSSSRRLATGALCAAVLFGAGPIAAGRGEVNGIPAHPDVPTIAHVLNRIGYGPRAGDVERVQQMGLAKYIDEQLHPDRIADTATDDQLKAFTTLALSPHDLAVDYLQPAVAMRQELQKQGKLTAAGGQPDRAGAPPALRMAQQKLQSIYQELADQRLIRAVTSERQLQEVLVDFWFNHFNVYQGKGQPEQIYLASYERDAIRPHVLGKFRDLLGATAHSPAMLFYLDNWESTDPDAATREVRQGVGRIAGGRFMNPQQRQQQLQALKNQPRGLNENYGRELMELHTLGVDGGYTQQDVIAVARALTGWTIDQPRQGGGFTFRPAMHDAGPKTILGVSFPAGRGEDEGERVLDMLAKSPATAHHIAFELAQRFVADTPPASLVDRAAGVFLSTDGDLREVVRTIITSPEFFSADAYRAKVKTPLEFVASAVRASGATIVNAQPLVAALRTQFGMPLYGCQPPTGWAETADAWVNTGALLTRMNFALQLVSNQLRGIRVDLAGIAPDTSDATRDRLVDALLAGRVSDSTRQTLGRAQSPAQMLALTLGAPEFQKR